jgi:hypothetical protein
MAKLQFKRLSANCDAQHLMAEANSENWFFPINPRKDS